MLIDALQQCPYIALRERSKAMHTAFGSRSFRHAFKRAPKQSLPQQPTKCMRSNGYNQYKKITYSPVEGVLRHYSRYIDVARCKGSTTCAKNRRRICGVRSTEPVMRRRNALRFAIPARGKGKNLLVLFFFKKSTIRYPQSAESALVAAPALSSATEKEHKKFWLSLVFN